MNGQAFILEMAGAVKANPLAARLILVSLELAGLALLVGGTIRVFRGISPRFQALVWLLVLAKPVLGLVAGTPVTLLHWGGASGGTQTVSSGSSSDDAALDARLAAQLEADGAALPNPASLGIGPGEGLSAGSSDAASRNGGSTPAATDDRTGDSPSAASGPATARADFLARVGWGLSAAWAAGELGLLFLAIRDHRRLGRIRAGAEPAPESLETLYRAAAASMGIAAPPRLLLTDEVESPALIGVVRRAVLLPRALATSLDRVSLRWAMRHELMHGRNHDPIGLVVRRLAEILFFFHPVVWWAGRKWEEAMERACDRALIESDDEARDYAGGLYRILEAHRGRRRLALGAGLFATRTQIGNRIAALLADPLRSPARLSALSMAALLAIAAGAFTIGLGTTRPAAAQPGASSVENKAVSAPAPTATLTDQENKEIREKVSKAHSSLRTLHTALEAYRVDNNVYPDRFVVLTTPIAYITSLFPDPFLEPAAPPLSDKESHISISESLKMQYAPDWSAIRLYSVGPDGVDEQGEIVYDPTNGTMSEGDVVRTIPLNDYVAFDHPERQKTYEAQRADLDTVVAGLNAWFLRHRSLPETLAPLKQAGILTEIPSDRYAASRPLSYRLDPDKAAATVYSVGPDGKDQGGSPSILGRFGPDDTPTGDIATRLTVADLEKRFPKTPSGGEASVDESHRAFYKAILAFQEKDGRENALAVYASIPSPDMLSNAQRDLVNQVLREGWSREAEALLPVIATWQPTFAEMRKGAALDYAHGIGFDQGPATPVPNFLTVQSAGKMMLVEARYCESKGEYNKALDDPLTVLTMGRDFTSPGNTLIGNLIGIWAQSAACPPIFDLVDSGALDRPALERLAKRLREIEQTRGSAAATVESERQCQLFIIDHNNEKETSKEYYVPPDQIATVKAELNRVWDLQDAYLETPYWKRDPAKHKERLDALLQSSHPFVREVLPNVEELGARFIVAEARIGLCRVATALALYRADHDAFPASLADLAPTWLDPLPVDPFSGNEYGYIPNPDRLGYRLFSAGPDRQTDPAQTPYDPTNGSVSAGDISFTPAR